MIITLESLNKLRLDEHANVTHCHQPRLDNATFYKKISFLFKHYILYIHELN